MSIDASALTAVRLPPHPEPTAPATRRPADPPSSHPPHHTTQSTPHHPPTHPARALPACSDGILALASCSSHITADMFAQLCQGALQRARRRAFTLGVHGQPPDHPFPAAGEELRYLKFNVHLLDG